MFKKIVYFLGLVAAGVLIWFGFALWTGIYSVYSYPPKSAEYPEGATLIISRDPEEPTFNSPKAPPPPRKKPAKRGGIGFAASPKPTRPVANRIIVELPYIEWAYEKSLQPGESQSD